MDQTLHQLGQLLFSSIPTILLFVLLHYFLKAVLYAPLRQVLAARAERIGGKLDAAQALAAQAEEKLGAYEAALRGRRVENYRHIEAQRQKALAEGQAALAEARRETAEALVHARQQLAAQSTAAHAHLRATAETLAGQILAQVLQPVAKPKPLPGATA